MINEPLVILTIGSSGSSTLMRMLGKCGMWVGHTYAEDHKDFMENKWVKSFNQKMLEDDRFAYQDFPPSTLAPYVEDAKAVRGATAVQLTEQGYVGSPWGFKDPRTVMTFPVWRAVYPNARWLVLHRDLDDIAKGSQQIKPRIIQMRAKKIAKAVSTLVTSRGRVLAIDYADLPRMFPAILAFANIITPIETFDAAIDMWQAKTYK